MSSEEYGWRKWREEIWLVLLSVQPPLCAICGRAAQVIDHDHESGLVRGLLCHGCNALEGGPGRIHPNHVRYREHPPAEALSEPIPYMPYPGRGLVRWDPRSKVRPVRETWIDRITAFLTANPGSRGANEMAETFGITPAIVRATLHRMKIRSLVKRTPDGWALLQAEADSR